MIPRSIPALLLVACTGGGGIAPPDPDGPPDPAPPEAVAPGPAQAPAHGVRTLTADTVRRAFEPLEVHVDEAGLRCAVFNERVILTRPTAKGTRDLRVRPRDLDVKTDCGWDGPVLVSTQVDGEVLGVVWPYIVVFSPGESEIGRLQIVQGITGGTVVEMIEVVEPAYVKSLTLGFGAPTALDLEPASDESCAQALERTWSDTFDRFVASGRVLPTVDRRTPTCPASAFERCELLVTLPFELMLGTTSPSPVPGSIGCVAAPPPRQPEPTPAPEEPEEIGGEPADTDSPAEAELER